MSNHVTATRRLQLASASTATAPARRVRLPYAFFHGAFTHGTHAVRLRYWDIRSVFVSGHFAAVRQHRGQSLVEFALTLPILLLLVFGGINGLQSAMTHYLVAWATREAANQAALDGGAGEAADQMAHTILDNGITRADKAKISIGCDGPCRRYQPIEVLIEYNDTVWVPLGPWNEISVVHRAVRASERDADAAPATSAADRLQPAPVPGTAAVPGAAP